MKLRVYKGQLIKAIAWYQNRLTEEFKNRIITITVEEAIKKRLVELQGMMLKKESNPVWKVPVEAVVTLGTNQINIRVLNEENLLFLDQYDF